MAKDLAKLREALPALRQRLEQALAASLATEGDDDLLFDLNKARLQLWGRLQAIRRAGGEVEQGDLDLTAAALDERKRVARALRERDR